MASTTEPGITAFVRAVTLGEDRRLTRHKETPRGDWQAPKPRVRDRVPAAPRVVFDMHGRELYSYGRHFPLARFVPAKRGRSALWLINGDRWNGGGWSLTSRHQSETREAIADVIADAAKVGKLVRSLVVPFSALDGAGITRDSIRPVHVREDRTETFRNVARVTGAAAESLRAKLATLPTFEAAETASRVSDPRGTAVHVTDTLAATLALDVRRVSDMSGTEDSYRRAAKITRAVCYRGYDYSVTNEHGTRGAYVDYTPPNVTVWMDGASDVTVTEDGGALVLSWQTSRHWLGDSVFTAERVTSSRVPCPNHTPDALVPSEWCDTCGTRLDRPGTITRETRRRERFVSSFDYNERAPLYFLAALPRASRAKTVDMAIEDLAPPAVHAAYARGMDVKRQGDVFAIATPLTDADVYARAVRRSRLHTFTHGAAKVRPGEVGFRTPLAPAAETARRKLVRDTFRKEMREHMSASRRPGTPKSWHAAKRAELHSIRVEIARHVQRIADGADVCGYDCAGYRERHSAQTGETCETCKRPRWYDRYTVANAETALARARERYAVKLAEPRHSVRDRGYVAKRSDVWNPADSAKLTDGNRARAVYARAVALAAAKYTPPLPGADIRRTLAIYGTAHSATEVAVCRGGVTYIRGVLRHVPAVAGETRGRDHAAVTLDGARWYLAVRNTVPRQ